MIYLSAMIAALLVIFIAAIFAPAMVMFNAEAYKAGEDMLLKANDSIQGISDPNVRASVTANLNSAFTAAENNININADIFQYGWVFVVILVGVIFFLGSRKIIEVGGQRGFV